MLNRSLKQTPLTFHEAWLEARRRFPRSPSRAEDFVRSYWGVIWKGKRGREKYRVEYGQGRRARGV